MIAKNRLKKIDFLKGIAIAFVVLGHFLTSKIAPENFRFLREAIYSFHMPLFMIISGYLYALTTISSYKEYGEFIRKKVKRLIGPYFAISFFVLLIKAVFQNYLPLENPISLSFFWYLFFNPMGGFATFLWFIYTLFIMFLVVPLLEISTKNYPLIFILALVLYFIDAPTVFCINLFCQFIPYFVVGILIKKFIEKKDMLLMIFGLFFLVSSVVFSLRKGESSLFIKSFLSLSKPLTVSLIIWWIAPYLLNFKILSNFFAALGVYSAAIYLFHTSAMAPVKILLVDFIKINQATFYCSIFIVWIIGVYVPIGLTEFIFNKNKTLSRLFLGVYKTFVNKVK